MEQHTSPNEAEQQQLAALAPSASKRRCSSNTIDVCAEGARSSVSSEVSPSFLLFNSVDVVIRSFSRDWG